MTLHGLDFRVARNARGQDLERPEEKISRSIAREAIESGRPVVTEDAGGDTRFASGQSVALLELHSVLCVPLKVKNELIGVIYADNGIRTGIFAESERDLLLAFANQAAVAIENARLFSSLKHTLEKVTTLKNLMDNVFTSIASGVITADVQDQVTLANRAAENILGHAATEILGHNLEDVLAPIAGQIKPHLQEVRLTDKPIVDLEISHTLPSRGGSVDWRLNLSPTNQSRL